jgi:hypothetical protein
MDEELWHSHCAIANITCDLGIELLWERCKGHRGRWWKEIYMEWAASKRNWRLGNHHKRLLKLAKEDDAITTFKYDVDKIIIGTRCHELRLYLTHDSAVWDKPSLEHSVEFFGGHSSAIMCMDYLPNNGHILVTGDARCLIH